jgi:hypothetical protein
MAGRRSSSLTRVSAWALALALTIAYGGAALGVLMLHVELPIALPWWALATPPLVYLPVVALAIPKFRFKRFLAGVLAVCTANVVLAVLTAALVAAVEPSSFVPTLILILGSLPALALLRLVWAPLILLPFRDLLAVRTRYPARERAAGPIPTPGPPLPPLPLRSPTAPVPPRPAAPERTEPVAAPRATAPVAAVKKPAPAPAAAAPAARGPVDPADLVRIPFERIASQLPPEAFAGAVADVGSRLREPGQLLVPRAMVVPQLLEGEVRIAWDVVAEQFPAEILAVRTEQLARRLASGLVLPLDEIVRQLPQEMFAFSGPTIDVRRLEDYPVPFQPHLAPSAPEVREDAQPLAAAPAPAADPPRVAEARASQPPAPSPVAELRLDAEPEKAPAATPPDEIEFDALTQVLVSAAEQPAEPAVAEPALLELESPVPPSPASAARDQAPARIPVTEGARANDRALEVDEAPRERIQAAPAPAPRPAARPIPNSERITAGLARHFAKLSHLLEIEARQEGDFTLFVVAPSGALRAGLAALAAQVALVLVDERFPDDPALATISGDRGAAVVTPLGGSFETAPLLVAMSARAGSLALLESLARRAGAAVGLGGASDQATGRANGHGPALQGFGPVSASRQHPGGPLLHLAVPAGIDADPVADLAVELYRAGEGAVAAGVGAFQSIAIQCASLSLVVREVESAPGRAAVLVAVGGPERRPGLARLQIERAAVQLGAGRA